MSSQSGFVTVAIVLPGRLRHKLTFLGFLVLDFGLNIPDGVRGLHLQHDGLAMQRLHEDVHAS